MADDTWATYAALREAKKQKKSDNRDASSALLRKYGVEFTYHNGGSHLVVTVRAEKSFLVDFWPGTGLWRPRRPEVIPPSNRGVRELLKYLMSKSCPEAVKSMTESALAAERLKTPS